MRKGKKNTHLLNQLFVDGKIIDGKQNYNPLLLKRITATFIDIVLFFSLYFYFNSADETVIAGANTYQVKFLISVVFWFIYFPFLEWEYSATLGHKIMGLKVVSQDGNALTLKQVFKRRLADVIDLYTMFGFIAFAVAFYSQQNQRLGDLWAKTLVVKKETTIRKYIKAPKKKVS